jgi:hypothetical protein
MVVTSVSSLIACAVSITGSGQAIFRASIILAIFIPFI